MDKDKTFTPVSLLPVDNNNNKMKDSIIQKDNNIINNKNNDKHKNKHKHNSSIGTGNIDSDVVDDDDDYFADVGFMFEAQQPVRYERFQWDVPSYVVYDDDDDDDDDENDSSIQRKREHEQEQEHQERTNYKQQQQQMIQVGLHVADDNPGAIQSGHYLWPAAIMLSEYLIENYSHQQNHHNNNIKTVIELGAGCALSSLTVLQLWKDTLQCICITDHDPGTLIRARDNYETTIQLLINLIEEDDSDDHCNNNHNNTTNNTNASTSNSNNNSNNDCNDYNNHDERLNSVINNISSIPVLFESLEWGDITTINHLLNNVVSEYVTSNLLLPKDHHHHHHSNNKNNRNNNNNNVTDNKNSCDNNMNNTSMQYGYFDIVLGSDVIYSIDIVRPLFITACTLMKQQQQSQSPQQQQSPTTTKSRFIMAQSFEYDIQIENEINQLCFEYNLQRTIKIDFDTTTTATNDKNHKTLNNNNNKDTTTNVKWGRIQEFTFRENNSNRVEHDIVTSNNLPEIL